MLNIYDRGLFMWIMETGELGGDGIPLGEDAPNNMSKSVQNLCGKGFEPEEAWDFLSQPWLDFEPYSSDPEAEDSRAYKQCYTIVTDKEPCLRWLLAHGGITEDQLQLELAKLTLRLSED